MNKMFDFSTEEGRAAFRASHAEYLANHKDEKKTPWRRDFRGQIPFDEPCSKCLFCLCCCLTEQASPETSGISLQETPEVESEKLDEEGKMKTLDDSVSMQQRRLDHPRETQDVDAIVTTGLTNAQDGPSLTRQDTKALAQQVEADTRQHGFLQEKLAFQQEREEFRKDMQAQKKAYDEALAELRQQNAALAQEAGDYKRDYDDAMDRLSSIISSRTKASADLSTRVEAPDDRIP